MPARWRRWPWARRVQPAGDVLVPLVLVAGAVGRRAADARPRARSSAIAADEVVTTLLLNFVALLFVQMMLEGPLKDPMGIGWPQSEPLIDRRVLPRLVEDAAACRLADRHRRGHPRAVMINRTVSGFEIRAVGDNAQAARSPGLPVTATCSG